MTYESSALVIVLSASSRVFPYVVSYKIKKPASCKLTQQR